MVAQKHCPLTILGNLRSLLQNVDDRKAIFHLQRHEHAGHERKVKTHVRFVAFAEISRRVLRPLVGLCKQHAIRELRIDVSAQLPEILMRLRQVLTITVFPFVQVRDSVETKSVYTHGQPEVADLLHGIMHGRVIKVQVWLVRIEPMPVVRFCNRVPRPVRCLKIFENDSGILVFLWTVAPDVEILVGKIAGVGGAGRCGGYSASGLLEPRILIGSVIDYQFGNYAQITLVGGVKKRAEIIERAEIRINIEIISDVVAVVAQRRRIERQHPDGCDP